MTQIIADCFDAIEDGDIDEVRDILKNGLDINSRKKTPPHKTLLHVAVDEDKIECVELLLRERANVNCTTITTNETPLHSAAVVANIDIAKLLKMYGCSMEIANTKGELPMHYSAKYGKVEMLEWFMHAFPQINIDTPAIEGFTMLHSAVKHGKQEMVKFLLARHANVNAKSTTLKITPLHYALMTRNIEITKILLQNGADVDNADTEGQTALDVAVAKNCTEIIRLLTTEDVGDCFDAMEDGDTNLARSLLYKIRDVNMASNGKKSLLHKAVSCGQTDLVELILRLGAHVNYMTDRHETALHVAAATGSIRIAVTLIDHGASINVVNHLGETPTHYAAKHGHLLLLQWFMYKFPGIDIDIRTEEGYTMLHLAVENQRQDVVAFLLKRQANVNAVSKSMRYSPLHFAIRTGNESIITMVIENCANAKQANATGVTAYDMGDNWKFPHVLSLLKRTYPLANTGALMQESRVQQMSMIHLGATPEMYHQDLANMRCGDSPLGERHDLMADLRNHGVNTVDDFMQSSFEWITPGSRAWQKRLYLASQILYRNMYHQDLANIFQEGRPGLGDARRLDLMADLRNHSINTVYDFMQSSFEWMPHNAWQKRL